MEIVGIDVGYSFTKTSTGMIFPSKITTAEPMLGYTRTLKRNNTLYYVGTGIGTVSMNKCYEDLTSTLTMYAICGAVEGTKARVVVGLPVGHFKAQRDALRSAVMGLSGTVEWNGQCRTITIEDAAVYPQGLLPVDDDYISVDIGYCTDDKVYIENGEVKYAKTTYYGMQPLYSRIMDAINQRYESKLDDDYAHIVLNKGLVVAGKRQDTSFLRPIIRAHAECIAQEIRKSTPSKMVPIYITGGGGAVMFGAIKELLPEAQLWENGQFSNAEMYQMVGEQIWE